MIILSASFPFQPFVYISLPVFLRIQAAVILEELLFLSFLLPSSFDFIFPREVFSLCVGHHRKQRTSCRQDRCWQQGKERFLPT